MLLGEIISNYRREHKLSQRQFAELCGDITNGYISMLENNRNPSTDKPIIPSIDKLKCIAHGMNMSLQSLLDLADDMPVDLTENQEVKRYPNLIPITRTYKIPLLGKVAAGKPIQTNPEDMEFIELPHDPGRADAALRVEGDSMTPRYLNGDIVYIRYQDDVEDGQIGAVCIDDTVTLKKVYHIPNGVYLVSENPSHPPMTFTMDDADNIHLVGLAIGYLRWEH